MQYILYNNELGSFYEVREALKNGQSWESVPTSLKIDRSHEMLKSRRT